jgi:hypothetical protein
MRRAGLCEDHAMATSGKRTRRSTSTGDIDPAERRRLHQILDDEIERIRRDLKLELAPQSDVDVATIQAGLKSHRQFMEVLERHLDDRQRRRTRS